MKFEWDSEKEKQNIQKHGINFNTATQVFYDEFRIEKYDEQHSISEDRYIAIGIVNERMIIVAVSYTARKSKMRIISARIAAKSEKEEYFYGKNGKGKI